MFPQLIDFGMKAMQLALYIVHVQAYFNANIIHSYVTVFS